MIRSLMGWMLAVCIVAVTSDALGQGVKMRRKAMVTGPRKAMVNRVRKQSAPQAPQGNRASGQSRAPYGTNHYYQPPYQGYGYQPYGYGYGYQPYGYRWYPRYYGGYWYGPAFVPSGPFFGPALRW